MTRMWRIPALWVSVGAVVATTVLVSAAPPKFYDDDPVAVERNTQDASGVRPSAIDLQVDFAYNAFANPGDQRDNVRAKNVNTIDQVPDSSWYSNRFGHTAMTVDAVLKGSDTTTGPAVGAWTLTASKSDGVTPGFTVTDRTGQRWFLKFDPPGHRAMATGSEVVVTRLMWALGYNVAENHIAYLRRGDVVIADNARYTPAGGASRVMRSDDLDALLTRADREPDGSYRVIASKALEGAPLGGFRFHDTRPDDPNDLVPHEHRRELRGYGVFAAWVNHVDAKAINSLDTLVTENGRHVVRHHLLDFGSTLGSGGVAPTQFWEGREYLVDVGGFTRQILGFGFVFPSWHRTDFYEAPAIGRLPRDNTDFDAERWRTRIPNQAFLRARADDHFWAAERLALMTDEILTAVVHSGQFGDATSEAFLVTALAQRRDAIVRRYLASINPIVDPALDAAGVLTFRNAAVDRGVAAAPGGYRARWFAFDNVTRETRSIGETTTVGTRLQAPSELSIESPSFVKVEISATDAPHPSWATALDVYFRRIDGGWRLVGLERMP